MTQFFRVTLNYKFRPYWLIFLLLSYQQSFALWDEFQYSTDYPAVGRTVYEESLDSYLFDCTHPQYNIIGDYCTVTLIGTKTLLSAAHCVREDRFFRACDGDSRRVSYSVASHESLAEYLGEGYSVDHDLRVITLENEVQNIAAIPFNTDLSLLEVGKQITLVGMGSGPEVSGYGCRPPECERVPNRKRVGLNELKMIDDKHVEHLNPWDDERYITSGFATGGTGDSGGPILLTDKSNTVVTVGVASGGFKYTRTDAWADWIMRASNYNARPNPPANLPNTSVRITKHLSDRCLVADQSTDHTPVRFENCGDDTHPWRQFNFVSNAKGLFKIETTFNKRCLYADEFDASTLKVEECTASSYRWSIYNNSDSNSYMLIERPSDMCLSGYAHDPFPQLALCNENALAEFSIESYSSNDNTALMPIYYLLLN